MTHRMMSLALESISMVRMLQTGDIKNSRNLVMVMLVFNQILFMISANEWVGLVA